MAHAAEYNLERASSLQTFLILQAEQETIRRRLSSSSIPTSPTSPRRASSISPIASRRPSATSATLSPVLSNNSSASSPEHAIEDCAKLVDVDEQIKATLTTLLNSSSVRRDPAFRSWIQARLMDAQLELKQQRRRRSCDADFEAVAAIKQRLGST